MEKIKIYTIENCPYCVELKELLIKEGVEFTEVNVNLPENDAEYNKIHKITKSDDVPVIKVGKKLFIPNVSFRSISEVILLIKRFLV